MKALILSGIPWNTTLQRHHKISTWLKEMNYDVYFIEAIPSSKFSFKKVLLRLFKIFNKKTNVNIEKNVKVFNGKFLTPDKIFTKYNNKKINKLFEKIPKSYDIVVNYLPISTTYNILSNISYDFLIYDCVRDFENWGGYPSNVNYYENKIIEKSNIVLTDSFYLTNKKNGVQFLPSLTRKQYDVFKNNIKPDKIKNIVYFGQIDKHIDIDILKKLSSNYNIHLIGNSNIKLNFPYISHGFISDKEKLAIEISKCDAIIIPYKGNMDGVIPAKLVESLASNLPVFISPFYDSEKLNKYCYVYHNYDELLDLIRNYKKEQKEYPEDIILDNLEDIQYERFKKLIK